MASRYSKILVGAVVLTSTVALLTPVFYPGDTSNGEPRDITTQTPAAQNAQQVTTDNQKNDASLDPSMGTSENAMSSDYASNEENMNDGGYGDLLNTDGAPAPANSDESNKKLHSGVVVGIVTEEEQQSFVNNPTATGTTPADAARAQEEAKRQKAIENERKQQQKLEQEKNQEEQRKKQAQLDEQRRLEEQRQLLDNQRHEQEKQRLAQQQLEEQKLRLEKEKKEAEELRAKQEAEKLKNADSLKYPVVQPGRYLQVGAYSTAKTAEDVKNILKSRGIRVDGQYKSYIKSGFGYKIESRNGKFLVLVGPASNDAVLKSIKPSVDATVHGNSMLVGR